MFTCIEYKSGSPFRLCETVRVAWHWSVRAAWPFATDEARWAMDFIRAELRYRNGEGFVECVEECRRVLCHDGFMADRLKRNALRGVDFAHSFAVANRLG